MKNDSTQNPRHQPVFKAATDMLCAAIQAGWLDQQALAGGDIAEVFVGVAVMFDDEVESQLGSKR